MSTPSGGVPTDVAAARRGDRVAVGALLAVVLFLFSDALRPGWTFWYRDIYGYWSAQAGSFVRVVAEGALPLWNPYVSFGLPMLADPSYQVAYPPTWLNLVLGPVTYYKCYVVAHALWAGVGLYLLLRRLGLGWPASFSGAMTWIASGPFLVVVSHTHHFAGTAWIPWVLVALDAALEHASLNRAFMLGVVAAAQVLAGSGDLCLMTAFLGAGWIAARAMNRSDAPRPRWSSAARSLGIAAAVAAGLSAIQWLPTLSILRSGFRLEMQDLGRLYWSLHPASLIDFLVPRLVADLPVSDAARAALFESREPLFADHYVGAAALALVATGLFTCRGLLRNYAALGLATALILSLGGHTPVYPALMRVTPLGMLRFPSKYVIAVGFLWALLVALGADAALRAVTSRRASRAAAAVALALALLAGGAVAWLMGHPDGLSNLLAPAASGTTAVSEATARLAKTCGVLAVAGWLVWLAPGVRRGAAVARGALVVLALGDVALAGRRVNTAAPAELLTSRPQVAQLVPEGSRLYVSLAHKDEWLKLDRKPQGWDSSWAMALGWLQLVLPPTGARFGLNGSYDGDFTGLAPPLLSNLTLILSQAGGSPLGLRLLRMAGVDYVVAPGSTPWPVLQPVTEVPSVLSGPVRLFRVPGSFPEAVVRGQARWAGEPASVNLLADAAFDPDREVILAGSGVEGGVADFVGQVRELSRRADRLELEVETSHRGYLVVLRTHDAGWRAFVDGAPAPLLRANVLFQGVVVPAGRHVVHLTYRPQAVLWGAGLSALCASVLIGLRPGRVQHAG
ncbi:MAG TPA: YfhO family protein [Vicinamibacteria bacterium]|nr:YfhO family protein [Vicinamibacteria bacterium]